MAGWRKAEAKKAALFGLNLRQSGFNLIVLGEHGSGRSSLMQSAMHEVAKQKSAQHNLHDLVAIYDFEQLNQPTLVKLPVGFGAKLRAEMDAFARALMLEMPNFAAAKNQQTMLAHAEQWLDSAIVALRNCIERL